MMKKIILICALFFSLSAIGQSYTYIAQRYEWLAGLFKALGLPAGDSAQFQIGQRQRAGSVYYDSTGVDSGLYVWTGLFWRNHSVNGGSALSAITAGTAANNIYTPAHKQQWNWVALANDIPGFVIRGTPGTFATNDTIYSMQITMDSASSGSPVNGYKSALKILNQSTESGTVTNNGVTVITKLGNNQLGYYGESENGTIMRLNNAAGTALPLEIMNAQTTAKSLDVINGYTTLRDRLTIGNSFSPTAFLDLAAGTTSYPSVFMRSGIAPSSLSNGQMWNSNDTSFAFRINGSTWHLPYSFIWNQIATGQNASGWINGQFKVVNGYTDIPSAIGQSTYALMNFGRKVLVGDSVSQKYSASMAQANPPGHMLELTNPASTSDSLSSALSFTIRGSQSGIMTKAFFGAASRTNSTDNMPPMFFFGFRSLNSGNGYREAMRLYASDAATQRYELALNDTVDHGTYAWQYKGGRYQDLNGESNFSINLPSTADTTNFKPMVRNPSTGEERYITSWPTGSGGGATAINDLGDATGAGLVTVGNNSQQWDFTGLTGSGLLIQSNTTAATNNTHKVLRALTTGANASSSVRSFAFEASNSHTGTGSINVGASFSATNGDANHAIIVGPTNGNVGFGTDDPAANAVLELSSTTRGFLLPRMNTTQQDAISSPTTGLVIYNTDSSLFRYYNGSAWVSIGTGGGGSDTATFSKNIMTLNTAGLGDAQTLFFGYYPAAWTTASATQYEMTIEKNCTLISAIIDLECATAGTAEDWSLYVRVNNTTDNLVETVAASANRRVFNNQGMSVSLSAGDKIVMKLVNPTWVTNPANCISGGTLIFK